MTSIVVSSGDQIQAAIDMLPDGGEVMLSEGVLTPSRLPIRLRRRIKLRGSGPATVIRVADGLNANVIELADKDVDLTTLSDFCIDGNKANQESGHGIFVDNEDGHPHTLTDAHHSIENVVIHDCKQDGIHVTGDARETMLHAVKVYTCDGSGFYNYASDMKFTQCISGGNGTYGFAVEGWNAQLTNCKAFWNHGKGFRLHVQAMLANCQSEENWQTGFEIVMWDNLLAGCVAHNNGRPGARSEGFWIGGDRTQLSGCYAYDNHTEQAEKWQGWGYVIRAGATDIRLNGTAYNNHDGAVNDQGASNVVNEVVTW